MTNEFLHSLILCWDESNASYFQSDSMVGDEVILSDPESQLRPASLRSAADLWQLFWHLSICSNSTNCPMKLRFGEMIGRLLLTSLYASTSVINEWRIRYAIVIVADREIPAWQWTNTLQPFCRASSVQIKHNKY